MIINGLIIKWQYHKDVFIRSGQDTITTKCIISNINNDEIVNVGVAYSSPKDVYIKETGRKLALERAMINSKLTKEERSEIWEKYRTLTKIPRWSSTLPK